MWSYLSESEAGEEGTEEGDVQMGGSGGNAAETGKELQGQSTTQTLAGAPPGQLSTPAVHEGPARALNAKAAVFIPAAAGKPEQALIGTALK